MEPAIWGFFGALTGGAVSIFTTRFNSRNALEIHRLKSLDERAERARVFQRETLLEVQEAIQQQTRLASRAHMSDIAAFRAGQEWRLITLDETLNEEIRAANTRMSILRERVADDALRDLLHEFQKSLTQIVLARSADDSDAAMEKVVSTFDPTMAQLGAALRTHY